MGTRWERAKVWIKAAADAPYEPYSCAVHCMTQADLTKTANNVYGYPGMPLSLFAGGSPRPLAFSCSAGEGERGREGEKARERERASEGARERGRGGRRGGDTA